MFFRKNNMLAHQAGVGYGADHAAFMGVYTVFVVFYLLSVMVAGRIKPGIQALFFFTT
ncbi:hypothetical protein [Bergeriella denitrificans]|uniref:hypothetical protein n=1 Tax=Bergeriella denitrificans TaxID=494 RepID=UPI0012E7C5A7|nr:hypothetical protein [Bergeriella denitrificans]